MISKTLYEDGRLHGRTTTYYEDGQVESIIEYKNGKINGESKLYDRDGRLIHNSLKKNGCIYETNYDTFNRYERLDEYDEMHI